MCSTSSGNAGQRLPGELRPTSDADDCRALARRFEDAVVAPSARAMTALNAATIICAASMRAAALTPERGVIALKAALRGHGGMGWAPSLAVDSTSLPVRPEVPVYEKIFAWWVRAYFAEAV